MALSVLGGERRCGLIRRQQVQCLLVYKDGCICSVEAYKRVDCAWTVSINVQCREKENLGVDIPACFVKTWEAKPWRMRHVHDLGASGGRREYRIYS